MSLRSLSDSQILSRLQKLIGQEREITLLVLVHLNEVERRKLHLKLGYASLFDYCTSKLGLFRFRRGAPHSLGAVRGPFSDCVRDAQEERAHGEYAVPSIARVDRCQPWRAILAYSWQVSARG